MEGDEDEEVTGREETENMSKCIVARYLISSKKCVKTLDFARTRWRWFPIRPNQRGHARDYSFRFHKFAVRSVLRWGRRRRDGRTVRDWKHWFSDRP